MCRKGLDRHKSLAFPNGGSYNYFNKSDGGELVRQAERKVRPSTQYLIWIMPT